VSQDEVLKKQMQEMPSVQKVDRETEI